MKVTKEVKANRLKWIKALESGRFKQTRAGRLRYHGRYCCLGVWCRISDGWGKYDNTRDQSLSSNGRSSLGMTYDQMGSAMTMNDDTFDKSNFKDIGKYFRTLWKVKS